MPPTRKTLAAAISAALILLSPGLPAYQAAAATATGPGAASGRPILPALQSLTAPSALQSWSATTLQGVRMGPLLSGLAGVDWSSPEGAALAEAVLKRLPEGAAPGEFSAAGALAASAVESRARASALRRASIAAKTVGELQVALEGYAALQAAFPLLTPGQRGVAIAYERSLRSRLESLHAARAETTVVEGTRGWELRGEEAVDAQTPVPAPAPLSRAEIRAAAAAAAIERAHAPTARPESAGKKSWKGPAAIAVVTLAAAGALAAGTGLLPAALVSLGLVGSILLHETAHLFMLRRLGDDTAAKHGHGSLNPFHHVDLVGTVLVPMLSLAASSALFGLPLVVGWAKPIPVDFNKLPDPKRDSAKVALAGPLVNLALAGLAFAAFWALPLLGVANAAALAAVKGLAVMNLGLGLFNLLPLPHLDGGKVLVRLLPESLYRRWTKNPRLSPAYQGTFRKLYEGPANLLTRLGIDGQREVNLVVRLLALGALAAFYAVGFAWMGAPLLFMLLVCSYDYYCIREKIVNEEAVQSLIKIMQGFASELAQLAEEDETVKSVVNTEEVEHVLKNALEDLIDRVVDSEGFEALDEARKWDRFEAAYLDAAVEALHKKGMSADDPATIRRLLTHPRARQAFFEPLKAWFVQYEVFAKWHSPGRKAASPKDELRERLKTLGNGTKGAGMLVLLGLLAAHALGVDAAGLAGMALMAGTLAERPAKAPKTFVETLEDPELRFSDKEKALLVRHLVEMKLEKKHPMSGRLQELRQVLSRINAPRGVPSSVALIGKAGVGKTAIPEKLAQAMARADSQSGDAGALTLTQMSGRFLLRLNLSRLLTSQDPAGALDAMLELIDRVNAAAWKGPNRVVVFVDEFHQLMLHRDGDRIANMILEPLASGQQTFIIGTTQENYRKHIEADDALKRRLPAALVEEPGTAETLRYLEATQAHYEETFGAGLEHGALRSAAEDSQFDQEAYNPGKAFDYVRAALTNANFDTRRDLAALAIQDKLSDLGYAMGRLSAELSGSALVTEKIKKDDPAAIDLYNAAIRLAQEAVELYRARAAIPTQGTPTVGAEAVKEEIARKTGISIGQLSLGQEPMEKYLKMEEALNEVVIGQPEAVHEVSEAVRAAKAGLQDPDAPLGVFYLTGPTGTGKTYFAKKLAEYLFGSEDAMVRLDMTEYMHDHEVSKMIGAPPGYVGYDQGGQLTEAVRKRPFSVVLLDEIEKASPAAWLMLLQILAEGRLTDGKGRLVSFKNTIVLMSSNLGMMAVDLRAYEKEYKALQAELRAAEGAEAQASIQARIGEFAERMARETKATTVAVTDDAFRQTYPPEFAGRLSAPPIVFNRITPETAPRIVELELKRLKKTLAYAGHQLSWDASVTAHLVREGFDLALGARPLKNALKRLVTQPIANEILKSAAANAGKIAPSALRLSTSEGAVRIAVEALPPRQVGKAAPAAGAAEALFTRAFGAVLAAAAGQTAPAWSHEVLDSWTRAALADAPPVEPAAAAPVESAAAPAGPPSADAPPEFSASASSFEASHHGTEAKDPGALKAAKSLNAALAASGFPEAVREALLRTIEKPEDPYVGWLKLFVEQAKRMTPEGDPRAPVSIRFEAGAESVRVAVSRGGRLSAQERALLAAHFDSAAPADADASRSRAELMNVRGLDGRRLYFDLARALARLPGARLGYRERDGAVQYWIELPKALPAEEEPLPPTERAPVPPLPEVRPDWGEHTSRGLDRRQAGTADINLAATLSDVGAAMRAADYGSEALSVAVDFLVPMAELLKEGAEPGEPSIHWQVLPATARLMVHRRSRALSPEASRRAAALLTAGTDLGERLARLGGRALQGSGATAYDGSGGSVWIEIPKPPSVAAATPGDDEDWPDERPIRRPAPRAPDGPGDPGEAAPAAAPVEALIVAADAAPPQDWQGKLELLLHGPDSRLPATVAEISTLLRSAGWTREQRRALAQFLDLFVPIMREQARGGMPDDPEELRLYWETRGDTARVLLRRIGRAFHWEERAQLERAVADAPALAGLLRGVRARVRHGSNDRSLRGGASVWVEVPRAPAAGLPTVSVGASSNSVALDIRLTNDGDPAYQTALRAIRQAAGADRNPSADIAVRRFLDRATRFAKEYAREQDGGGVEIEWGPRPEGLRVSVRRLSRLRVPFHGENWVRSIRDEQGLSAVVERLGARVATESADRDGVFGLRINLDLPVRGAAQPAPAAAAPAPPAAAPGARRSLADMVFEAASEILLQGDQRGPTARISAAEAMAAAAGPYYLTLAREWIGFEDMGRRHPEVAAAAMIIARHGNRADDEARLVRAMELLDRQSGHLYNPAKRKLSESLAKLLSTGDAGQIERLQARLAAELAKSSRNEPLVEALYMALCRSAGIDAMRQLAGASNFSRLPYYYEFLRRVDPVGTRALYQKWREDRPLEFNEKLLALYAAADFGERGDSARALEAISSSWGGALDIQTQPQAGEAFAKLVARTQAYADLAPTLRTWLRGTLGDSSSFGRMIAAIQAAGAAGNAEDLPLLERILNEDPEHINYVHEMSQHEAARAWAGIVARSPALIAGYLTQSAPGQAGQLGLPRLWAMLGDRNSIVSKAALETLILHLRGQAPARQARPRAAPVPPAAAPSARAAALPIQADPTGFFRPGPTPGEGSSNATHYGPWAQILIQADSGFSSIPDEQRALAMTWADQWKLLLETELEAPIERVVRTMTRPDGGLTVAFIVRHRQSQALDAFKVARVAAIPAYLLGLRVLTPERRARKLVGRQAPLRGLNGHYETLSRLAAQPSVRMGLDYEPGRLTTPARGSLELWLSIDLPAPPRPPTPYRDDFRDDPPNFL